MARARQVALPPSGGAALVRDTPVATGKAATTGADRGGKEGAQRRTTESAPSTGGVFFEADVLSEADVRRVVYAEEELSDALARLPLPTAAGR
mmetsp:Transcript_6327/g.22546  ORF Transcript_6327/g.22546 Transcript_6327/m.22546 type:complete len:93 (-) Transcript_6327:4148-4426(-)